MFPCFLLLPNAGQKSEAERWEGGKEEPHQLLRGDLSWGVGSQGAAFVPGQLYPVGECSLAVVTPNAKCLRLS